MLNFIGDIFYKEFHFKTFSFRKRFHFIRWNNGSVDFHTMALGIIYNSHNRFETKNIGI